MIYVDGFQGLSSAARTVRDTASHRRPQLA